MVISRLCATPFSTTNANMRPRSGTTAASGTSSAAVGVLCIRTDMNVPGFNVPSSFAMPASTLIARVTGSTRESTVITLPSKVRPGRPDASAVTASPSRSTC
jgi:hypothetical protein